MNRLLLLAAVLAAVTTLVHIFAGGADVAAPLLASALHPEVKYTLYACWHLVSLTLGLSAGVLFWAAHRNQYQPWHKTIRLVGSLWAGFGGVFLVIALACPESGGLIKLPQWILLLAVGILAWWGSLPGSSNASPVTQKRPA